MNKYCLEYYFLLFFLCSTYLAREKKTHLPPSCICDMTGAYGYETRQAHGHEHEQGAFYTFAWCLVQSCGRRDLNWGWSCASREAAIKLTYCGNYDSQ